MFATASLKSDQPSKPSQAFYACSVAHRVLRVVRIEVLRMKSCQTIRNTAAQNLSFEVNNAPSFIV